jgi:heptosyltransferase-3
MATTGSRILVIGIARIGDTLLMTPGFRAIKAGLPDSQLTVFAHPKRRSVLAHFEPIDHLVGMTKRHARFLGWLPGKSYNIALVYGRDTALLNYALRASERVICFDEKVFSGHQSPRLLKVALPTQSMHAVDERLMLIHALFGEYLQYNRRLGLTLLPTEKASAQKWLVEANIRNEQGPLIGLQACSFPTKAHRDWPAEHFLSLITALLIDYPSAHFLILGDHVAAEKGRVFKDAFPTSVSIAAGQMNLRQSAALMNCLDLYVGVDTGPTHIAGALGIPMVAMYHHRYPGHNLMPLDNPHCKVIEHPETGQEDAKSGMEAITFNQVLDAAKALLGESHE